MLVVAGCWLQLGTRFKRDLVYLAANAQINTFPFVFNLKTNYLLVSKYTVR